MTRNSTMSSRGKNKKFSDNGNVNKKLKSTPKENGDVDVFGDNIENNNKIHPALGRLSTGSPINISPRRKRSLLYLRQFVCEDDLELNDDEAELKKRKKEKELELQKEKLGDENNSLSNFNLGILSRMTATELKEHVMQCVKLSTENKITTKNAFALQLIDCMAYMLKKESGSDFSTMACTLDASAKIYSLRVDSICNDVSKLVDAFLAARKRPTKKSKDEDDRGDGNESDDDEEEPAPKTFRFRKHKKNPAIVNEESLTAKPVNKNFLRNYMKMEVCNGAFISRSVWDPKKQQPSLEKGILLLQNFENQDESPCEVDISDFFSKGQIETLLSKKEYSVDEKQKNDSNMGLEDLFVEAEKADKCKIPEMIADVEPRVEGITGDIDAVDDWEFHDDGPLDESLEELNEIPEKRINCVPDVIKQMEIDHNDIRNGELTRRTEKLQAMFDKGNCASEYSYLEQTYSPVWTGPDYWKKSYKGRFLGHAKKGGKKKKEPLPLTFDIPLRELQNSVSQKLSRKTMLNWKEKKVTVPEDLHINPNLFLQLFYRPKDRSFIYKMGKSGSYMVANHLDGSNTVTDVTTYSQDLLTLADDDKTSHCEDYDGGIGSPCQPDGDSFEEMKGDKDDVQNEEKEIISSNTDLLDGSNLIPAPKMVATQEIKYATRPNKVDMKELKTKLFNILAFDYQNKENKGPLDENAKMKFSELYAMLGKSIPTADEDKQVSPSMAFLALLHLANENNLVLQNLTDDDADFIISPGV